MKNIHESISKLLTNNIQKYKSRSLNSQTCTMIYQDMFETICNLFQESKINISNEAVNLVCQMYYDSISINNNQSLDPNIFSQRASVKNLETKELSMLASFFTNTQFALPLIQEIKHRS